MSDKCHDDACELHGPVTRRAAAEARRRESLPKRVIVDQHGHYWRDYGEFLSMCPVSTENTETETWAVFVLAEAQEDVA